MDHISCFTTLFRLSEEDKKSLLSLPGENVPSVLTAVDSTIHPQPFCSPIQEKPNTPQVQSYSQQEISPQREQVPYVFPMRSSPFEKYSTTEKHSSALNDSANNNHPENRKSVPVEAPEMTYQSPNPPQYRNTYPLGKRKSKKWLMILIILLLIAGVAAAGYSSYQELHGPNSVSAQLKRISEQAAQNSGPKDYSIKRSIPSVN